MKIYIKNMVCRGTRLLIVQELERLGLAYESLELGLIDFKRELSLKEINELDEALGKYGLEVTFRDIRLVTEIRCLIHELAENHIPLWEDFSNFVAQKAGASYAYLNKYFRLETGLSIEKYYIEKSNETEFGREKDKPGISAQFDILNTYGKSA